MCMSRRFWDTFVPMVSLKCSALGMGGCTTACTMSKVLPVNLLIDDHAQDNANLGQFLIGWVHIGRM